MDENSRPARPSTTSGPDADVSDQHLCHGQLQIVALPGKVTVL